MCWFIFIATKYRPEFGTSSMEGPCLYTWSTPELLTVGLQQSEFNWSSLVCGPCDLLQAWVKAPCAGRHLLRPTRGLMLSCLHFLQSLHFSSLTYLLTLPSLPHTSSCWNFDPIILFLWIVHMATEHCKFDEMVGSYWRWCPNEASVCSSHTVLVNCCVRIVCVRHAQPVVAQSAMSARWWRLKECPSRCFLPRFPHLPLIPSSSPGKNLSAQTVISLNTKLIALCPVGKLSFPWYDDNQNGHEVTRLVLKLPWSFLGTWGKALL